MLDTREDLTELITDFLEVRLRHVEGWSAEEVCAALELGEGNQRVLPHRGRSRLRAALDRRRGHEHEA